ncbi:pro-resilin-like isoform X2 [Ornithodoros turicata]|uniref:pro-resilin-like isoform X2 n=1 Tax=Ornithodoros turicata TaxID=34597 RepID=UPI003138FAFC
MKVLLLISFAVIVGADFFHTRGPATFVQFQPYRVSPSGYSFVYSGVHPGGGSFHKESSDTSGNVAGSYGLKDADGRYRAVSYVADGAGFRASVQSNEPGLGAQNPSHVSIVKGGQPSVPGAPASLYTFSVPSHAAGVPGAFSTAGASGSYNFAYGDPSSGPWQTESGDNSGSKSGSYGLQDSDGRVRTVKYVADAGGFRASVSSNEPGVESDSPADVVVSKQAELSLSASDSVQGHSAYQTDSPSGVRPSEDSGPTRTGYGTSDASGNYNFAYGDTSGGSWQQESGDASGSKSGSYGLADVDGRVRTVNYVADAAGFRATVNSNEPGVESGSPADVDLSKEGEHHLQAPSYKHSEPLTAPESHDASATGSDALPGPVSTGYGTTDGTGGYSFSYGDTSSGPWQREVGDATNKLGSYGFTGPDGHTRTVSYTADDEGFHATITSNEPGVEDKNPADVKLMKSEASTPEAYGLGFVQPRTSVTPTGSVEGHGASHIQTGTGGYSFSYGDTSSGPWQREAGDATNKLGSYGFTGPDGRTRTVSYTADDEGFHATITSNEPGVEDKNPADVKLMKSEAPTPEAYGSDLSQPDTSVTPTGSVEGNGGSHIQTDTGGYSFSYGDTSSGPWQREAGDATNKLGSYGFTGPDGRTRTVSYTADDEGFHATITSNEPGVEDKNPADVKLMKSEASTPDAYGSVLAQPDTSVTSTGSVEGHDGSHTQTGGTSYSFGYSSGAEGGSSFHKESGDASGSKMGSYGLKGADGTVRTVHYVADTQGFRASIRSNEPGVDASKSPASTTITGAGAPVTVFHGLQGGQGTVSHGLYGGQGTVSHGLYGGQGTVFHGLHGGQGTVLHGLHGGQGSGHGGYHKAALVVPVAYVSPAAIVHPGLFSYKVQVPHWTVANAQQWKK